MLSHFPRALTKASFPKITPPRIIPTLHRPGTEVATPRRARWYGGLTQWNTAFLPPVNIKEHRFKKQTTAEFEHVAGACLEAFEYYMNRLKKTYNHTMQRYVRILFSDSSAFHADSNRASICVYYFPMSSLGYSKPHCIAIFFCFQANCHLFLER